MDGSRYMLSEQNYTKILNHFDKHFWERKTDEANWSYYGLILDWYFDQSVLSIDYIDIEDFFDCNGGFSYWDSTYLSEQYSNLPIKKCLQVLENILNILKHTSVNKEQNLHMVKVVTKVLLRDNIKVINPENGYLTIKPNDIFDSGSYCNIIRVREGV